MQPMNIRLFITGITESTGRLTDGPGDRAFSLPPTTAIEIGFARCARHTMAQDATGDYHNVECHLNSPEKLLNGSRFRGYQLYQ